MPTILREALSYIKQGCVLVEATIIHHQGSTPRTAGAKMFVVSDGKGIGTVGGGMLEAQTIREALGVIRTGRVRILSFELTGEDVADSNMLCGGNTRIFLDLIHPDQQTITMLEHRCKAAEAHRAGHYLTIIKKNRADEIQRVDHCFVEGNQEALGTCPLPPDMMDRVLHRTKGSDPISVLTEAEYLIFIEATQVPMTAYVFGAGHVSQFTARLASQVGFRVVILDDRTEFANDQRFPEAHQILVISDFNRAFSKITADAQSFVLIITRGHIHDKIVLAQALRTEAAYIGMIGSRRKRDTIYRALASEGFSQQDLDRVHCPIGLEIEAETPEEIAVSIVAQMIRERAGLKR
jgi:xanthine dehydrogenase accessory factor